MNVKQQDGDGEKTSSFRVMTIFTNEECGIYNGDRSETKLQVLYKYFVYGLDDRGSRVRFPVRVGNFSLQHRVQNGSGAHSPSYPMGTRGSFPGGKVAGA
jgi:hypothetical protein